VSSLQLGLVVAGVLLGVGVILFKPLAGAAHPPAHRRRVRERRDKPQASDARVEPTLAATPNPGPCLRRPPRPPRRSRRRPRSRNRGGHDPDWRPPMDSVVGPHGVLGDAPVAPDDEADEPAEVPRRRGSRGAASAATTVAAPDADIETIVMVQPTRPATAGALSAGLHARIGKPVRWLRAPRARRDRGSGSSPTARRIWGVRGVHAARRPQWPRRPRRRSRPSRSSSATSPHRCRGRSPRRRLARKPSGRGTRSAVRGTRHADRTHGAQDGAGDDRRDAIGVASPRPRDSGCRRPVASSGCRTTRARCCSRCRTSPTRHSQPRASARRATSGVVFLLDVPRVVDPPRAFDQMKLAAKRMAQTVGGELVRRQWPAAERRRTCRHPRTGGGWRRRAAALQHRARQPAGAQALRGLKGFSRCRHRRTREAMAWQPQRSHAARRSCGI